ncbi:MAG: ubiquitin-specific protease doa4 [Watsoniomyces obsoletus]|nr:MAG: ubiquitin-specific protease doa4 [Watsoniomyces obsoletus]
MGPAAPSGPRATNHNNMPNGFPSNDNVDSRLTNGRGMSGQTTKGGPSPQGPFPPLEELVARGEPKVDINTPIKTLLQQAGQSAKQADTYLSFNRPDLAYVEYLTAFNIVVHVIPRHKDFPSLSSDRGDLWRLNKGLQAQINGHVGMFNEVRNLIKEDNARRTRGASAVQSRHQQTAQNHDADQSVQPPLRPTKSPYDAPAAISMPEPYRDGAPLPAVSQEMNDGQSIAGHPSNSNLAGTSGGLKRRPVVVKKPTNLRFQEARPSERRGSEDVSGDDALLERFSRLRSPGLPPTAGATFTERPSSASGAYGTTWSNPAGMQSTPYSSTPSLAASGQAPSATQFGSRPQGPQGPREMPRTVNGINGTLQVDVHTSLPRAPSPTYSPARNLPALAGIHPPRTTARSIVGTGGRSSSLASARVPERISEAGYLEAQQHGLRSDSTKTQLLSFPEFVISATQLYHMLQRGSDQLSVLLMDLRGRAEFDEGHIYAPSVICVEPICLRPGMSAEDVAEALVLSPENEQRLFQHRHRFDLIVMYDQSSGLVDTAGRSASPSIPAHFDLLKQALQEYDYEKPVKRPAVHLAGGLDSWVDLVGPQSLKTSKTAFVGSDRPVDIGLEDSRTGDRMRNGYLNGVPDQVSAGRPLGFVNGERRGSATPRGRRSPLMPEDDGDQFPRTYDDFLRRFPEPSEIKTSMTTPSPVLERSILDHPFHGFTGVQAYRPSPPSVPSTVPGLTATPSRPAPAVPRRSYSGVSERGAYQIPAPSRPPPVVPPRPTPSDALSSRPAYQIGRTGLTNFGNTCYMNATLQCLSATAPLARYFLDGSYKGSLQRQNKFGSKGELPEAYAGLMGHLWSGNFNHVSPKSFREVVARLNTDFRDPDVQHDANDFLFFLLDKLHEDLNLNWSRNRLNDLTPAEERKRESMPPQVASRVEWGRWAHRNNSWVSSLFAGQHMSRLQCPVCGCTSTSYETFYTLPLEIPRKGKAHITDCLKNYTKEEKLGSEDTWTCPNCKVPREATKRITITRAPQVLVIQLKRFRTLRRGFSEKNNSFIDFPLTGLDLTPYSVPPLPASEARQVAAQYGPGLVAPDNRTTPPFEYDAYGVVEHYGTLSGGHYTALVRGAGVGEWFDFNDRNVRGLASRGVQTEAAYLLFYVRSTVQ